MNKQTLSLSEGSTICSEAINIERGVDGFIPMGWF